MDFNNKELDTENHFDTIVAHNHERATNTAEQLRNHSFVHSGEPFVGQDLIEAIKRSFVESLINRLLTLQHHSSSNGVEGIVEGHDNSSRSRDCNETGDCAKGSFVFGVGVHVLDLLKASELAGTVDESTRNGHAPARVQPSDSLIFHGCHDAVSNSRELGLSFSKVRRKTSSGKIERVANCVGNSPGQTAGEEFHSKALPEILRGVLGEGIVEEVVECKSRALLGGIAEAVHQVASPKGTEALLCVHAPEAVSNSVVSLDFSRDDVRVGVHGLQQQLDSLDRSHDGFTDGAD